MKKSDAFKISSAWWKKEKPPALLKSGLGEALTAYEGARGKVTADPKTYATAKTALDAVEDGRLKAIKNCGVIFPDAQVVLKGGQAVINTERTLLKQSFHALLKAKVDPIEADITKDHKLLKEVVDSANKILDAIPQQGQRVGMTPTDPKQKQMEQLISKVESASYFLRARASATVGKISNNQSIVNTARAQDACQSFIAAITAARDFAKEALILSKHLSELINEWEDELQGVNNNWELKRLTTT